jgi:translation initiation factor 2 beta subunit (eIF-2beta)/eIF-5
VLEVRRYRGGFRRLATTELGDDFYVVRGRSLGYECKACISERRQARIARVQ